MLSYSFRFYELIIQQAGSSIIYRSSSFPEALFAHMKRWPFPACMFPLFVLKNTHSYCTHPSLGLAELLSV